MLTVSVMVPAVTLTLIVVGIVSGRVGDDGFRVKLIDVPILPLDGVTVNALVPVTPGVVTVAVNVPDPVVVLVAVWPHSRVCVFGRTINAVGVGVGGSSPFGPSTPITCDVSTTRFWVSVTMSWLAPHPVCVARKLPPLVVTIEGKTVTKLGNGVFTV